MYIFMGNALLFRVDRESASPTAALCTLWGDLSGSETTEVDVLKKMKNEVPSGETVTVVYRDYNQYTGDWCGENRWRYIDCRKISGCEDRTVVILGTAGGSGSTLETLSRARNNMFLITHVTDRV